MCTFVCVPHADACRVHTNALHTHVRSLTIKCVLHITPHREFTLSHVCIIVIGEGRGSFKCEMRVEVSSVPGSRVGTRRNVRMHICAHVSRTSARVLRTCTRTMTVRNLRTTDRRSILSPATPTLLKLPRPRTMSPDETAALIRPATKRILAKPMIRERKQPRAERSERCGNEVGCRSPRNANKNRFLPLRSSVLDAFTTLI